MGIKLMMCAIASIIFAIILGVVSLSIGSGKNVAETSDVGSVAITNTAYDSKRDPMEPISSGEADRRATLHNENAEVERMSSNDPAYVAAPVVERIGNLGDPDELATKLFGQDLFTSEPLGRVIGIQQAKEVTVQETEPETKSEPIKVAVVPDPVPIDPELDTRLLLSRAKSSLSDLRVVENSQVQSIVQFLEKLP